MFFSSSKTRTATVRACESDAPSETGAIAGIPWYLREHYPEVLRVMIDAGEMFADFDHWLAAAEQGVQQMEARGYRVFKTIVAPTAFAEWCRVRRLAPNQQARFRYASEAAEARAAGAPARA